MAIEKTVEKRYNFCMGKITKIEEQKKAKDRVNIYVDDVFAFGLSSLLLVDCDIYKGKEVNEAEIEKYKSGDDLAKCLAKAYNFLSYRMRSEKEMREKLLEKYNEEIVEKAIQKLAEYNYVNDDDFGRAWVNSRKLGRSKKAISFELKRKGLTEEVIERSLNDLDSDSEFEAALELIKSRKKYHDLSRDEAYQKVGGFLSRRGYGYDVIKKVIKEMNY